MRRAAALGVAAGLAVGVGRSLPSVLVLATFLDGAPSRLWGVRYRVESDDSVALTIDDGPDRDSTPALLHELDRHGLRATFFLSGVALDPGLVREIADRGHEIATHGHAHRHHLLAPPGAVTRDLELAVAELASLGRPPRFFRPPYGQLSSETLFAARRTGVEVVLWSGWGREFADPDLRRIAARLQRRCLPGAILLLHDSDRFAAPGSARRTRETIGRLAEALSTRGLQSRALGELC